MTRPCTRLSGLAREVTSLKGSSREDLPGARGRGRLLGFNGLAENQGSKGSKGGFLRGFADYEKNVVPLNYLRGKNEKSSYAKPCKLPHLPPFLAEAIERDKKKQGGCVFATSLEGGGTSLFSGKSEESAEKAAICLEILTIGAATAERSL